MEILYFTVIAVGLYAISDALLNYIERSRGTRFENRQLVFFAIILVLALITFQTMSLLMRQTP
jgi:cell division protein FtsW (lipid II flippase)